MNYLTEFDWRDVPIKKYSGLLYFYAPDHPLASSKSLHVNLARHIVSVSIGRWLTTNECIKYKDGDPLNIDIENLQLQHFRDTKYTGKVDASRLTSDELLNLAWRYSPRDAARMLNIPLSFFYNLCKAMGISLPPPRYWLFLKAVKSRPAVLMLLGWSNDAIIALSEKLGESVLEIGDVNINPYPPDTDYMSSFDWRTARLKNVGGRTFFYAPEHPLASKASGNVGWVSLAKHIVSVSNGYWLKQWDRISYKDGNRQNIDPENLFLITKNVRFPRFRVPLDEIWNTVWRYPKSEAARLFGTTRNTLTYYCKRKGILMPPRGYWNLVNDSQMSPICALVYLGWSNDAIVVLSEKLGKSVLENVNMSPYPPDTDYMSNFDWRTAKLKNMGGRTFFYAPDHPLASKKLESFGWVYLAKHIVSVSRGYWLTQWDHISHKDGNLQNTDIENLLVITKKYWSVPGKYHPPFRPPLDEIWNIVWRYPRSDAARLLGIAINTISNYCKRKGILTPPSGYWTLVNDRGIHPTRALAHLGWQEDTLAVLRENVHDLFQNEDMLDIPTIDYLKDFDWHTAKITSPRRGLFFIARKHPLAHKGSGCVNLARHIISVERGKWLEANELIKYKDGNPHNIDLDNILVVGRGQSGKSSSVELVCPVCGKSFKVFGSRIKERVTDTPECKKIWSRKYHYTANDLWLELWQHPQRDVAKMFMTGRKFLRSRCKEWGVTTPPMGYWNLIQTGRSREEALLSLGWQAQQIDYVNSTLMAIIEERPDAVSTSMA